VSYEEEDTCFDCVAVLRRRTLQANILQILNSQCPTIFSASSNCTEANVPNT
jgi:hypothetical protein